MEPDLLTQEERVLRASPQHAAEYGCSPASREMTAREALDRRQMSAHSEIRDLEIVKDMLPLRMTREQEGAFRRLFLFDNG